MNNRTFLIGVAALALLAGCQKADDLAESGEPAEVAPVEEAETVEPAPDVEEPAGEFAGLVLTGRGHEPGWSVRIEDGAVAITDQFGTDNSVARVSELSEDGSTRTISAYAGERLILITQGLAPCQDDATGAWLPYSVTVQVGERMLRGCGGTLGERLMEGEWLIDDVNGSGIIDSSHLTMRFGEDGTVSGSAGCNNYTGSYTASGLQVEIGPLGATRKICPAEAIMLQEQRMLEALTGTLEIEFAETGVLTLRSADGSKSIRATN